MVNIANRIETHFNKIIPLGYQVVSQSMALLNTFLSAKLFFGKARLDVAMSRKLCFGKVHFWVLLHEPLKEKIISYFQHGAKIISD